MTVGAVLWAIVGFAIAMSALPGVNQDARVLVTTFSIAGPLCAVGAAWLIHTGQLRRAGLLLVISVATPTYFAFALNISALVLGTALIVRGSRLRC
jgi:hypothetical protein